MKTTDVSKFFLGIFERTYDGLHICQLLEALACLIGAILHSPT